MNYPSTTLGIANAPLSLVRHALRNMSNSNYAPENCIVFEDSLSGVAAGKAAGAKVVGVATTHTFEELQETDFVIADFVGLDATELLERIFLSNGVTLK